MALWTRDQLLLALNLYFQTPFGKQDSKHSPIIALAEEIGRTPSAVSMKLNNFTSLDPSEKERGVTGLSGASKLDRQMWNEFSENRNELAAESEKLLEELFGAEADESEKEIATTPPSGPTEKSGIQKTRLQQRFFRRVVLSSYGNRCCISGLPVPALLRASHIVPWAESEEQRLNPRNGLCLASTYDAAFDRGLISFDQEFRLILGETIKEKNDDEEIERVFVRLEGKTIIAPAKNLPQVELMANHREKWGYAV